MLSNLQRDFFVVDRVGIGTGSRTVSASDNGCRGKTCFCSRSREYSLDIPRRDFVDRIMPSNRSKECSFIFFISWVRLNVEKLAINRIKARSTSCTARKRWAMSNKAVMQYQFPVVCTNLIPCALFISGKLGIDINWKAGRWIHWSIARRKAGTLDSKA